MNPEKQAELKQHLDAIAKLLYEEADPAELTTLEGIEKNVRAQAQKHVLPQLGVFFINAATDRHSGKQRTLTSILGASDPDNSSSSTTTSEIANSLESLFFQVLCSRQC